MGWGGLMKIKYLLSDLDGVIRIYPPERASSIEQKLGLPSGAIFSAAFEKTLITQAVCGHMTDEVWRSEIAKSLSKVCGESIAKAVVNEWSDFSGIVDHRYLQHIESKFSNVPIAVLTNGTSRLKSDLTKLGIENRFFKIFNSADIGVCKPDLKIYHHVVASLGCNPSEVLFVDDSLSHIEAARDFGMVTHHYRSFEEFQNYRFFSVRSGSSQKIHFSLPGNSGEHYVP
jgi:phosphoglycolate phosphatase-like HAD superfamily hydrolase